MIPGSPILNDARPALLALEAMAVPEPIVFGWILGGISFVISLCAGPRLITWLAEHCREPIRTASDQLNVILQTKRATPTLGGVLLLGTFLMMMAPSLAMIGSGGIALVATAIGFGAIGFWDDWTKLRTCRRGITARQKLGAQIVVAGAICWLLYTALDLRCGRFVPGFGNVQLGLWIVPLWMMLVVGFSNSVNLTDGMDGLAAGCSLPVLLVLYVVTLGQGADIGTEALAAMPALAGSVAGLLAFNRYPARVFMGNTGALALGALISVLAILACQELVLCVAGLVFVVEAGSVCVQVAYFKWSGRRILHCAPLHHHFQFCGWPEPKIVHCFWLAGVVAALAAIGTAALCRGWEGERSSSPLIAAQDWSSGGESR